MMTSEQWTLRCAQQLLQRKRGLKALLFTAGGMSTIP